MNKIYPIILITVLILISCNKPEDPKDMIPSEDELYFPPTSGGEWEAVDLDSIAWNENELDDLYEHLMTNGTRAFIVLKNGKIALEKYWGNNIINTSAFNVDSEWYWASAAKTLTASLVGIAQKDGILDIDDKSSNYLGNGWTSLDLEKEDLITIKNQLTMTSGLDYEVADLDCTEASCLEYGNDAGTQWYYHNAPYTLLQDVVKNASGIDYNAYTDQKIESLTGMNGEWIPVGSISTYFSTARDMARFGLFTLNKGSWNDTDAIYDESYYNQMINSSQELNLSYGYLWWLNGKSSIMLPGIATAFNAKLSNNAPDDLIAGMGKNGQFVDIVPSQNLIVIRMGDAPSNNLVPIIFHDEMWEKLNLVINE